MTEKISLEEFDDICDLPKPLQTVLRVFRSEFQVFLKRLIGKLDLVTKDEFLVQKRLLEEAYAELERLKKDGRV